MQCVTQRKFKTEARKPAALLPNVVELLEGEMSLAKIQRRRRLEPYSVLKLLETRRPRSEVQRLLHYQT